MIALYVAHTNESTICISFLCVFIRPTTTTKNALVTFLPSSQSHIFYFYSHNTIYIIAIAFTAFVVQSDFSYSLFWLAFVLPNDSKLNLNCSKMNLCANFNMYIQCLSHRRFFANECVCCVCMCIKCFISWWPQTTDSSIHFIAKTLYFNLKTHCNWF